MAHAITEISNKLNQLLVCTLISNMWVLIKNFMNESIARLLRDAAWNMCWGLGPEQSCRFVHHQINVIMQMCVLNLQAIQIHDLFKDDLLGWWCTLQSHTLICDMIDNDKRMIMKLWKMMTYCIPCTKWFLTRCVKIISVKITPSHTSSMISHRTLIRPHT